MIYLKKLYRKAAVFKKRAGQITLWLALIFLVFTGLYLVCLQSVKKQLQRQHAEQAVEAGLFSLFSEYEPHLLTQYDLFYIDTSFASGSEKSKELCSHLWHFTDQNITGSSKDGIYGLAVLGVQTDNYVRATDGKGAVFYRQAIQVMKEKTGFSLAEDWLLPETLQKDTEEQTEKFEKDCAKYEGKVVDYEDEEEELSKEAYTYDGLWKSFTLSHAVPKSCSLSKKAIPIERAPSRRELSVGVGTADGTENQLLQKQWFISYLCEYLTQAEEMFKQQRQEGYLDYQLEYLIAGEASDGENLEQVLQKLLLIREGVNYLFLLAHPEMYKTAEKLAKILGGLTGGQALFESLKHLILLGWAYGESLVEVRQLLGGYELSVVKSKEDWQVPLSALLKLTKKLDQYDTPSRRQEGITYEIYLRMFLSFQSAENLAMRALDVIEGELKQIKGCEQFHVDHCIEQLSAQVWMQDLYLERTYGYE